MGRNSISDNEKKTTGTYRKDRVVDVNPNDFVLDAIPEPPDGLTEYELEFYSDECEFLNSVGMLTRNRHKRIILNSMWWHLFKTVGPKLREKDGYLVTYPNKSQQIGPNLTVLKEATNALKIYFADRDKIKAPPTKKKSDLDEII